MIMKKKTAGSELIGKTVFVTASQNPQFVGIEGFVIDETRNTITIKTEEKVKKLPKDQLTLKIENKNIDGKDLIGRIEERIKKT